MFHPISIVTISNDVSTPTKVFKFQHIKNVPFIFENNFSCSVGPVLASIQFVQKFELRSLVVFSLLFSLLCLAVGNVVALAYGVLFAHWPRTQD